MDGILHMMLSVAEKLYTGCLASVRDSVSSVKLHEPFIRMKSEEEKRRVELLEEKKKRDELERGHVETKLELEAVKEELRNFRSAFEEQKAALEEMKEKYARMAIMVSKVLEVYSHFSLVIEDMYHFTNLVVRHSLKMRNIRRS